MSKPKRTTSKRAKREWPIWERAGLAAMNAVARVDPTFPSDMIDRAIREAYWRNGYRVAPWPSRAKLRKLLERGLAAEKRAEAADAAKRARGMRR